MRSYAKITLLTLAKKFIEKPHNIFNRSQINHFSLTNLRAFISSLILKGELNSCAETLKSSKTYLQALLNDHQSKQRLPQPSDDQQATTSLIPDTDPHEAHLQQLQQENQENLAQLQEQQNNYQQLFQTLTDICDDNEKTWQRQQQTNTDALVEFLERHQYSLDQSHRTALYQALCQQPNMENARNNAAFTALREHFDAATAADPTMQALLYAIQAGTVTSVDTATLPLLKNMQITASKISEANRHWLASLQHTYQQQLKDLLPKIRTGVANLHHQATQLCTKLETLDPQNRLLETTGKLPPQPPQTFEDKIQTELESNQPSYRFRTR